RRARAREDRLRRDARGVERARPRGAATKALIRARGRGGPRRSGAPPRFVPPQPTEHADREADGGDAGRRGRARARPLRRCSVTAPTPASPAPLQEVGWAWAAAWSSLASAESVSMPSGFIPCARWKASNAFSVTASSFPFTGPMYSFRTVSCCWTFFTTSGATFCSRACASTDWIDFFASSASFCPSAFCSSALGEEQATAASATATRERRSQSCMSNEVACGLRDGQERTGADGLRRHPRARRITRDASEASPRGVGARLALPNGARGAIPSLTDRRPPFLAVGERI